MSINSFCRKPYRPNIVIIICMLSFEKSSRYRHNSNINIILAVARPFNLWLRYKTLQLSYSWVQDSVDFSDAFLQPLGTCSRFLVRSLHSYLCHVLSLLLPPHCLPGPVCVPEVDGTIEKVQRKLRMCSRKLYLTCKAGACIQSQGMNPLGKLTTWDPWTSKCP